MNLTRKMLLLSAAALAALPNSALACTVCFGATDSKLTAGMLAGVLVLLLVILSVLGGVIAFFVFVARRSAETSALESNALESKVLSNQ